MFRFSIRDLPWLIVVVMGCGWLATAHRASLLDSRLQAAMQQAEDLKARNEAMDKESKGNFAAFEALAITLKRADLSDEQRPAIGAIFEEEMKRRGISTVVLY